MPFYDFTVVTSGVDLLCDESQAAIEAYNDQFLDDPPLEPTFVRDAAGDKVIFSLEAPDFEHAVEKGISALREAVPAVEIASITPGRDPGPIDII